MGFLSRLLGVDKRMGLRATEGVDMVKVGLAMYLLPECEANYEREYATLLTAAVVNEVFSEAPSGDSGRVFAEDADNRKNVALVIERAIKPQENLRRILTDAIRVKCTQAFGPNANPSEAEFHRLCREPIEKLKQLGLLIPGGEMADLALFLGNAGSFVTACKADLDAHRSNGPN